MRKSFFFAILILLLLLCAFLAYNKHFKYYLGKEYTNEINLLLENEIPKSTKEIDGLIEKIENEKDPYDKQGLIEYGTDGVFFDFYSKLIDLTEKYVGENKITNNLPAGDNVWEMHEALIPYFKNNKINTSKIYAFIEYGLKKQKKIEEKYAI